MLSPTTTTGRGGAGFLDRQVLVLEQTPDVLVLDFLLGLIGVVLHDLLELDLQTLRQIKVVVGLEQVAMPPLPDWEFTRMMAS